MIPSLGMYVTRNNNVVVINEVQSFGRFNASINIEGVDHIRTYNIKGSCPQGKEWDLVKRVPFQ